MPSRWIECPIHNTVMRITATHETSPGATECEWIMWRCMAEGCSQIVTEVTPGHPLIIEAFTTPGTIRRFNSDGSPSDAEAERLALRRPSGGPQGVDIAQ